MSRPPYRILMVCTGNICRSPVMERVFVARVQAALPPVEAARFQVRSVGTRAEWGRPIEAQAAKTLVTLGGDPADFSSRPLDAVNLTDAHLILTATRAHQSAVIVADPRVISRVLTLRSFAGLLTGLSCRDIDERISGPDPVERMTVLTAAAFARRGLVPIRDSSDADIADPYGRRRKAFRQSARHIDEALAVPLALLLPEDIQLSGRHRA